MGWDVSIPTFRKKPSNSPNTETGVSQSNKKIHSSSTSPTHPTPGYKKKRTENRTIHRSLTHVVVGISDTNKAYGTRNKIPSIPYHHHLSTFCLSTTKTIQKKREKI
jgi:hypothetical protein